MASPHFETFTTIMSHRTFERPGSDIKKKGYLVKMKTMKKKFFVLRSTSSSGPARLEYYDNEKKFINNNNPRRSIDLHTCLNINKKSDSKHKYAIALYTKDDCFTVLADNSIEQEDWLEMLLEYQLQYVYHNENREHFEHVWQVTIQAKGLAMCPEHKQMRGNHRLCLSAQNLCIFKINREKPLYTFQLVTVRSLAFSDTLLRMEVGSLATTGAGELWMQVDDAQHIHDSILQCMKAASDEETDMKKIRQRSGTMNSTISLPSGTLDNPRNRTSTFGSISSPGHTRVKLDKRPVSYNPDSSMSFSPGSQPSTSPHFSIDYHGNHILRSDSMESRTSYKSRLEDDHFSGGAETVESICEEDSSYNQLSLPSSPADLQEHIRMSPDEEGGGASPYMVMQPGSATPPTGSSGYVEMTSRSHRSADLSPASGESDGYLNMSVSRPPASSPIPIRGPAEGLYKDMSHGTPLPTVTEGGSNEGYLPMSPSSSQSPFSTAHLKPEPAVCMLSDDPSELPKRTYSLGSKPPVNTSNKNSGYLDMTINKGVNDKGRSCSAPHLIPSRKLHVDSPTPSASPLSTSVRSDDSESFMEFDFYRPRTASDSYSYRPRASSFGNKSLQAHRPRSSSHGQQTRTFKPKTFDSVRTTSEELRQSMSSCRGSSDSLRMSSSESLRKLSRDPRSKNSGLLSTDYLDMSIDKRKTPSPQPNYHNTPKPNGYMDMTIGNRNSSPSRAGTPQERSGSFSSGSFSKTRDKMIQERSGSFSSGTSHRILPVNEIPKKKSHSSDKVHNMAASMEKSGGGDMYMNMDMSSSSQTLTDNTGRKSGKDNSRSSSSENLESYVMYEPKVSSSSLASSVSSANKNSSVASHRSYRQTSSEANKRSTDRSSNKRDQHRKSGHGSKGGGWFHGKEHRSSLEKNDEYIEFSPMSASSDSRRTPGKQHQCKSPDRKSQSHISKSVTEDSSEYMGFEPGKVGGANMSLATPTNTSVPPQMVTQRSYFGTISSFAKEGKKILSSASFSGKSQPSSSSAKKRLKNYSISDESEYLDFEPAGNVKCKSRCNKSEKSSSVSDIRQQSSESGTRSSKPSVTPTSPKVYQNVFMKKSETSAPRPDVSQPSKSGVRYMEDDYLLTERLDTSYSNQHGSKSKSSIPAPVNPPCILKIDDKCLEVKPASNLKASPVKSRPEKKNTSSNNSLSTVSPSIGGSVKLDSAHARHSLSDLSGYEQMSFPQTSISSQSKIGSSSSVSSTGEKTGPGLSRLETPSNVVSSMSNLSITVTGSNGGGSTQQLTGEEEVLNYASLDLGSSENIGDESLRSPRIKSRHASATDDKVEPLSYAEIDFEKSESLKALALGGKSEILKACSSDSKS